MKKETFLSLLALCLLAVPSSYAAPIYVHAGDDLQTAINSAQPGDVLILDAGATFNGPITLPSKDGSSYITIQSSALAQLPAGLRVSPSNASQMPKIISGAGYDYVLATAAGASYYNLIGLEFRPASTTSYLDTMIKLGDATSSQNSSNIPHHLMIDRCYIHAFPTQSLKRGIGLNSSETSILNSYISSFKLQGQDSQAIAGWNGPGPFHLINNYLEAAGENLIFGGSTPSIPGLIPSNIEIRGNHLTKPLSWQSEGWAVKDLFELKSAQRVVVEGNIMENDWDNVGGYGAVVLTVRNDSGSWATIQNVDFRNNIVRHAGRGINILGLDDNQPSVRGHDIRIYNNLFDDINSSYGYGDGRWIQVRQMDNLILDHNTVFQTSDILSAYNPGDTSMGFVMTNNIANYNLYGISGVNTAGSGNLTMSTYFPGGILRRNVMINGDRSSLSDFQDNYYPSLSQVGFIDYANQDYRLGSYSDYISLSTDGTAIGANINTLMGIVNGSIRVQFSAPGYSVSENGTDATLTVTRSGDSSSSATVTYATSDPAGLTNCNIAGTGVASSRCDYSTTIGAVQFAPGEVSKTIFIPIVDDAYAEGNESFTVALSTPTGALVGLTSSATVTVIDNDASNGANSIDGTPFFVRQQYLDFLDREPDPGGYQGWQNILNNCPSSGIDDNGNYCDRIEVSSGFFRSAEFQDRGYFIYRFYATVGRIPVYAEFMPDLAKVSGFLSNQQLEANKANFVNEFMTRSDFQFRYGSLATPTAYVNALLNTVGLPNHPSRDGWIAGLANNSLTKAKVLRELTESSEMYQKYYTEAFVVMEYFGYLRRDPDAAYLAWIDIMNQNPSNYRTMINGFMNSAEYRQRFGN
jgi:hypothetical protein